MHIEATGQYLITYNHAPLSDVDMTSYLGSLDNGMCTNTHIVSQAHRKVGKKPVRISLQFCESVGTYVPMIGLSGWTQEARLF